jgi:putative DNA primase/helicase
VAELLGIFNWALSGLESLRERGKFLQPCSAAEIKEQFEDLGSTIKVFIRERCALGPLHHVGVDELYAEWKSWCPSQGRDFTTTKQQFGIDLHAAIPDLKISRPGGEGRKRRYEGIGITPL